jgi:two-component system phosphate regulon sensor histidine kinase PhoR
MSKRVLWILTISLSVVLLGLIIVQIKWIENANMTKNEQFKQLVNNTLSDVSRQLEKHYTANRMSIIIEEELGDMEELEWTVEVNPEMEPDILIDEGTIITKEITDHKIKISPEFEDELQEELIELDGDTVVIVTSEGVRIDTIHLSRYHDELRKRDMEREIEEKKVLATTIMKKMLLENISFEKRIEQDYLEKVLKKNLMNMGIELDFEYTVIKNNKSEVYRSENFDKNTDYYYFRSELLPNEIEEEENYLYLYFPGQKALIRGTLGFLATSTLLLTLLMLILFSFALYVIFRQKKLSDIKNDFVNNMTHELKTPISTISLASQMLNDDTIPEEKKRTGNISRIIQTESKRLGYQVERVLQMAVLDQGHLVLKCSPLSMKEIISTVVQNFRLQVENQNGRMEIIDQADFHMVNGDRVHLMNVMTNLLDNAVKYSNGTPEINIDIRDSEKGLKISVQDKGIGISKENQKRVFDRFFRVSTGNVHDVKGFGLGLSYVKLIVEQHNGSISLWSELNKGTRFDIILPLYSETESS